MLQACKSPQYLSKLCFSVPMCFLLSPLTIGNMFQSSTEVAENRQIWGQCGASSTEDQKDGFVFWGSLPIGRSPAGWLEILGSWGAGIFPTVDFLESGVPQCVAVCLPLKFPQYWSKLCFRDLLKLQEN